MERYRKKFFEEDEEYKTDPKVKKLILFLKNNNFGNEESRKQLLDVLTSLHAIKDKSSRLVFKAIGDLFTDIADDLIK